MAMGMGASPGQDKMNAEGKFASQANNTQNNRVGDFGTSREQQMAAANVNNQGLKKDANQTQPIGMGAGTGQQTAINKANESMQGQGNIQVGPQVAPNGKIQTGFGTTQDQAVKRGMAAQAEVAKAQQGVNAEMAKTADLQNAGLAQSMGNMASKSDKKTEMEDPSAPIDYNAVYNTEAEIFNQRQASDWNNRMDFMAQRAKERGMEGTDLSAYLSHMELGNRMGLLDARQSIMLEGLQKDMAFKEKGYWQDRADARADDKDSYNQYMELLNASWGDEEAVRGILEMAANTLGEDSYFANLLKNPDALRNLNDAGYNELFQQRAMAASNVLREMTDPMNMGEVNSTFGAYKNAKYGSAMDVNVPSDLTVDDLDSDIYADYVAEFGEPDLTNADDVKDVYAYQQYRKDVDNSFKDEVATGLVNEFLTNGGNPETAEKIRNLGTEFTFSLMEDEALSNYIGGQVNADDPINGPLSFMFSDWEGNLYADENDYQNKQAENKGMDLKWQEYMQSASKNGEEPISRWEWLDAAMQVATMEELDNYANASDVNAKVNAYLSEAKATEEIALAEAEVGTDKFIQKAASMSPSEYRNMWETEDNDKLTDEGFLNMAVSDLSGSLSWDSSKQELLDIGVQPGKIIQGTDGKLYQISSVKYWEDDDTFSGDEGALIIQGTPINSDGTMGSVKEIWRDAESGFDNQHSNDSDNWELEGWSK